MSISTQQTPIDTGIGRKPEAADVMENVDFSGKLPWSQVAILVSASKPSAL